MPDHHMERTNTIRQQGRIQYTERRNTSWSQGCVQCPAQFIAGNESINNNDRLKTVKTHFTFAWGPKKFTGRKGFHNEEASIMNLLHHFNLAQHQCPVTEQEFVALLCKSTAEEALRIMSDNLDKHAKGQITIQQICDNMTDIFFDDLRPGTASMKLRELTENHHPFHSMNEANIEISRLSSLAAKTSKTRERQEPVAADKYIKTFMKIIPKEFKAVAITLLDAKTQDIRRDLDPRDFMDALEPLRSNIDECFQKTNNRHNGNARIRKLEAELENTHIWDKQETDSYKDSEENLDTYKYTNNTNTKTHNTQKPQIEQNDDRQTQHGCKLCGNSAHESKKCPLFTGDRNGVASGECRTCRAGLFHFSKYCPRTLKSEQKN